MASVAESVQARPEQDGVTVPGGQHVVLPGIDWESYEKFLEAVGGRRIRLTYDRGRLEITAPLWNHEWWKVRFRFLLLALALELRQDIQSAGSPTIRREDVGRGLEPDECFYLGQAQPCLGQ